MIIGWWFKAITYLPALRYSVIRKKSVLQFNADTTAVQVPFSWVITQGIKNSLSSESADSSEWYWDRLPSSYLFNYHFNNNPVVGQIPLLRQAQKCTEGLGEGWGRREKRQLSPKANNDSWLGFFITPQHVQCHKQNLPQHLSHSWGIHET